MDVYFVIVNNLYGLYSKLYILYVRPIYKTVVYK